MTTGQQVPVLEVGGTHVTAAHVDLDAGRIVAATRRGWDASDSQDELVATIVDAVSALPPTGPRTWSIAIPGPFDYARGIGLFEGVGKLDALRSVDVGALLREALPALVADVRFLNDAHAFALGEWVAGAACGHSRVLGLTLGTGVGSAFLADGRLVDHGPDVPPSGHVYLLRIGGRSLEDTVSRRAIRSRYAWLTGCEDASAADLHDIAGRSRAGDYLAMRSFCEPLEALGEALAPWVDAFGVEVMVVGGSVAQSWDVVAGPLRSGLDRVLPQASHEVRVAPARLLEEAALLGAAAYTCRTLGRTPKTS
jgi:glucokinase